MQITTKTVQKLLYVASDGTEFNDRNECERYEKSLENPVIVKANSVKHFIAPLEYIESSASDTDLIVCFIAESKDEVNALRDWLDLFDKSSEIDVPDEYLLNRPLLFDCMSDSCFSESLNDISDVYCFYGTPDEYKSYLCSRVDRMMEDCLR